MIIATLHRPVISQLETRPALYARAEEGPSIFTAEEQTFPRRVVDNIKSEQPLIRNAKRKSELEWHTKILMDSRLGS